MSPYRTTGSYLFDRRSKRPVKSSKNINWLTGSFSEWGRGSITNQQLKDKLSVAVSPHSTFKVFKCVACTSRLLQIVSEQYHLLYGRIWGIIDIKAVLLKFSTNNIITIRKMPGLSYHTNVFFTVIQNIQSTSSCSQHLAQSINQSINQWVSIK